MEKLMKRIFLLIAVCGLAFCAGAQQPMTTVAGSAAYTNLMPVCAAPCKLYAISAYNSSASTEYVQIFQMATNPINGSIPTWSYPVAATQFLSYDFSYYGADVYPGCVVAISTTANSLTLATANCGIQAVFNPSR
jgi:hypothetical protein